jgi:oligoribonuclease NrnB/cAMP/cGMP phosphodiesterase (DHH superfamily)
MTIIHHAKDFDGVSSAVILLQKYPDATLMGMDYGQGDSDDDIAKIQDGDEVYVVDFCLEPFERMIKLNERCKLVWLDHHISAITESEKSGVKINGVRNNKLAGCELTWAFVFPDQQIPEAIKLLGRYDVWDKTDPRTDSFQFGMCQFQLDPKAEYWTKMLSNDATFIDQICSDGQKIQQYQKNVNKAYSNACAFEAEFEGYNSIIINIYPKGHFVFEEVPNFKEYDIMLAFCWKKDGWGISLYTEKDNVDCSAIAKKYGGGGHKKAAGFKVDTLPFKLPSKVDESIHSFDAWRKQFSNYGTL